MSLLNVRVLLKTLNMGELSTRDERFLAAAEGWLELGNWHEANEELERITPEFRSHPDVLFVRWQIYEKAEKWEGAFEIAHALSKLPDDAFGPVHMAYALHKMKRTKEALDVLLPVVDKFSDNYLIRYNLACYYCQLGNLTESIEWLKRAIELGKTWRIEVRKKALEDPDLEPLWARIGQI